MNATELTPELATLLNSARTLSSDLVREVTDFAEFLGRKHAGMNGALPNEEYDDWTEEDLRNHRIASMRRFEEEHGEENWGVDYSALGGNSCSPPGDVILVNYPGVHGYKPRPGIVVSSAAYHLV